MVGFSATRACATSLHSDTPSGRRVPPAHAHYLETPMTTFCTDIDLLHWEPSILRDAAFASQTLLAGTGDLAGTMFTLDTPGASFTASHVEADHVIVLNGGTSGCYPIVSVDGATQLTI